MHIWMLQSKRLNSGRLIFSSFFSLDFLGDRTGIKNTETIWWREILVNFQFCQNLIRHSNAEIKLMDPVTKGDWTERTWDKLVRDGISKLHIRMWYLCWIIETNTIVFDIEHSGRLSVLRQISEEGKLLIAIYLQIWSRKNKNVAAILNSHELGRASIFSINLK